jgi:hypothetical protein
MPKSAPTTDEPCASTKIASDFNHMRVRGFILGGAPLGHTKLGTPKPAVFALEAATSARTGTLLDPIAHPVAHFRCRDPEL